MKDNETNEELDTQEESNEELEETEESNEDEESTDEDTSDDTSTVVDWEKKAKTLEAQKEHWRKKAELKKNSEPKEIKNNENYLTRDEGILLTKGYDEDEISQLKRLAGDGSLLKAIEDPLFVAYKKGKEQKARAEKAKLGASYGGGTTRGQKPISEMTREEHKALFNKSIGK